MAAESNQGNRRDETRTPISPDISQALIAQGLEWYLKQNFVVEEIIPDFYVDKHKETTLVTVTRINTIHEVRFVRPLQRDLIDFFAERPNEPQPYSKIRDAFPDTMSNIPSALGIVRRRTERKHGRSSIFKLGRDGRSSTHELRARVIFGKYQG